MQMRQMLSNMAVVLAAIPYCCLVSQLLTGGSQQAVINYQKYVTFIMYVHALQGIDQVVIYQQYY